MNAATPTGYVQKPRAEPQRLAAVIGGMLLVAAAALYVWFIVGRALAVLSGAATDTSFHSTSALSAAICGHRKVSR